MPSGWPQLAPRPCVTRPEPSPSTVSSQVMKRVPPDLPHSEHQTTTQECSSTPLDPTTTFQLVSQPPVAGPEPPKPTAMSQSPLPVYLAPQLPELQHMPSNLPQLAPAPLVSKPEPPPSTTSCLMVPNPYPSTMSHPKTPERLVSHVLEQRTVVSNQQNMIPDATAPRFKTIPGPSVLS
jgi:hypothetical protein